MKNMNEFNSITLEINNIRISDKMNIKSNRVNN